MSSGMSGMAPGSARPALDPPGSPGVPRLLFGAVGIRHGGSEQGTQRAPFPRTIPGNGDLWEFPFWKEGKACPGSRKGGLSWIPARILLPAPLFPASAPWWMQLLDPRSPVFPNRSPVSRGFGGSRSVRGSRSRSPESTGGSRGRDMGPAGPGQAFPWIRELRFSSG